MSSLQLKTMYYLVLALTISSTAAFSLVGNNGNEFRFRASSTRMRELPKAFSFRMNYRMGTEEDNHHFSQQQHTINPSSLSCTANGGRMPKTVVHSSPVSDQDQDTSKKVDEYLEFLDKRYHRIHDNDGSPQAKKKSFSVLKWLAQENHTEPPAEETDALYALGVAGLASERLLQKHGVPPTKRATIVQPAAAATASASKHDSIVVDYESSSEDRLSLLLNKIFATFAAQLVSLQHQVATRRNILVKALLQTSKTVGKATLEKLPRATRDLARTLVKAGGGERNLKIAATVTCAFAIYFAQPLIKGAITRTTQV